MQEYTCVCLVQTQFESCKMCINQLHVAEPFQWALLTVIPYGPDAYTDVLCVRCSGPPSHLLGHLVFSPVGTVFCSGASMKLITEKKAVYAV